MSPSLTDSDSRAILIIEDSPQVRMRLVEHLGEVFPDSQVCGVGTIADAADYLSPQHFPDALILDLELPGRNGLNLLRAIKRERPEVGVIVFTCSGSDSVRRACMALGADFFFSKGEDLEQIDAAVGTLTARGLGRRGDVPANPGSVLVN